MSPDALAARVKETISGSPHKLDVSEDEAREIAYHYLRTHYGEKLRPAAITRHEANGRGEPTYHVDLVERVAGNKQAELEVGVETGSTYSYVPVS